MTLTPRLEQVRVSECALSEVNKGLTATQLTTYLVLESGTDLQVKLRG